MNGHLKNLKKLYNILFFRISTHRARAYKWCRRLSNALISRQSLATIVDFTLVVVIGPSRFFTILIV